MLASMLTVVAVVKSTSTMTYKYCRSVSFDFCGLLGYKDDRGKSESQILPHWGKAGPAGVA